MFFALSPFFLFRPGETHRQLTQHIRIRMAYALGLTSEDQLKSLDSGDFAFETAITATPSRSSEQAFLGMMAAAEMIGDTGHASACDTLLVPVDEAAEGRANMHDVSALAIMLVAILAGILLNRQDVHNLGSEVRSDIKDLATRMQTGFDLLHKDLSGFSRETGAYDARLDALEAKAKEK